MCSIQLLGRLSSDIIKSGGYKISSLQIEEAIREHDAVGANGAALVMVKSETVLPLQCLRLSSSYGDTRWARWWWWGSLTPYGAKRLLP